jgi:tetratricopeptide (TPR) repeat protein
VSLKKEADKAYQKAEHSLEKNDLAEAGDDFEWAGDCYLDAGNEEKAKESFLKAADCFEKLGENLVEKDFLGTSADNFKRAGKCYGEAGSKDKMEECYQKAADLYEKYAERLEKDGKAERAKEALKNREECLQKIE